jgi:PhoH-like ATPase
MTPIRDALELLQQSRAEAHAHKYRMDGNPQIEVEPLTYIRGRSIPNQYMIVDETQNLTPLEVKTVITRAGQGTKIILTGDMEQIDNPYVDQLSNGLNAVIQAFRNQPISAHVALIHGVRSEIAELASNLL